MPSCSVLILKFRKHEVVEQPLILHITKDIHIFTLVKTDTNVYKIMCCCPTRMDVTLAWRWLHVIPKYAAIFVTTKLKTVTELVALMVLLYPLLLISETWHTRLWYILTNISKGRAASILVMKMKAVHFFGCSVNFYRKTQRRNSEALILHATSAFNLSFVRKTKTKLWTKSLEKTCNFQQTYHRCCWVLTVLFATSTSLSATLFSPEPCSFFFWTYIRDKYFNHLLLVTTDL